MAISQKKYIDIVSGVGGAASAARRLLIARVFTTNADLTEGEIIQTDLAGTLEKFGDTSAEYIFAQKYFGFIGKSITQAPAISFAQYGTSSETPVEALTRVDGTNDNFGSFCFIETLSDENIAAVAAWVKAGNYKYLYSLSAATADVEALATDLSGNVGTILTADANAAQAHFMPMAIFAATDYSRPNAVKNFMYQKFDAETASVTDDTTADAYDALYINYLGTTQQAGKIIKFYQNGFMLDGADVAPYCNEVWLKDAISTEFMNLLLALDMIPANEQGAAIASNAIQSVIAEALNNGTISPNKPLTNTQKAYITQVSGDPDAWRDVGSIGYWLDVVITSEVVDNATQYIAKYTLIYSKGDSIRKVEGSDILI